MPRNKSRRQVEFRSRDADCDEIMQEWERKHGSDLKGILNEWFTSISVEYLVKTDSKVYIPGEIALRNFTLKQGISGPYYHAFIKPKEIPAGYRAAAMAHCQRHQIPYDGHSKGETHFDDVIEQMYSTLYFADDRASVYCLAEERDQVVGALDYLKNNAKWDRRSVAVFKVEDLFLAFKKWTSSSSSGDCHDFKNNIDSDDERSKIDQTLSRSKYDFVKDVRCQFHAEADIPHCSYATALKIWFHAKDYAREVFPVELCREVAPVESTAPTNFSREAGFNKISPSGRHSGENTPYFNRTNMDVFRPDQIVQIMHSLPPEAILTERNEKRQGPFIVPKHNKETPGDSNDTFNGPKLERSPSSNNAVEPLGIDRNTNQGPSTSIGNNLNDFNGPKLDRSPSRNTSILEPAAFDRNENGSPFLSNTLPPPARTASNFGAFNTSPVSNRVLGPAAAFGQNENRGYTQPPLASTVSNFVAFNASLSSSSSTVPKHIVTNPFLAPKFSAPTYSRAAFNPPNEPKAENAVTNFVAKRPINNVGTVISGGKRKASADNNNDKWEHDMFNLRDQLPKTERELMQTYGYNIRHQHDREQHVQAQTNFQHYPYPPDLDDLLNRSSDDSSSNASGGNTFNFLRGCVPFDSKSQENQSVQRAQQNQPPTIRLPDPLVPQRINVARPLSADETPPALPPADFTPMPPADWLPMPPSDWLPPRQVVTNPLAAAHLTPAALPTTFAAPPPPIPPYMHPGGPSPFTTLGTLNYSNDSCRSGSSVFGVDFAQRPVGHGSGVIPGAQFALNRSRGPRLK